MGKIIVSPHKEEIAGPLIFLAGPIQGASDWQSNAIGILSINPHVHIASPRRAIEKRGDFDESDYTYQVEWEWEYLARARENGVIMFWLPKPIEDIPGRCYAQTSRFELGEALAHKMCSGGNIVLGIEHGFSNGRYIMKSFRDKAPDVPIVHSLEEACEEAIRLSTLITR